GKTYSRCADARRRIEKRYSVVLSSSPESSSENLLRAADATVLIICAIRVNLVLLGRAPQSSARCSARPFHVRHRSAIPSKCLADRDLVQCVAVTAPCKPGSVIHGPMGKTLKIVKIGLTDFRAFF